MRLALFLAGLSVVWAQAPKPADQARALLKSNSLRERAWGAWYAGASHDPALGALLIERLQEAQSYRNGPRDGAEYAYVQSLFDALIQLGSGVPTSAMLPFEDSHRSEILILMNAGSGADSPDFYRRHIDPNRESALLELRKHPMREDDWAALNDLLFAIDARTATQKMLEEMRFTHEFCVTDQHTIRADDGSGGIGVGTRRFPKGFPPIALYQIRTHPVHPGDTVFIDSPIATYFARVVVPTDGDAKWFDYEFHGASTSARQRTIERFLSIFDTQRGRSDIFHPWTAVDWEGREATAVKIANLLDAQAASIRELVQETERRGVMPASGLTIPIQVIVRDCRRNIQEPLPSTAPVRDVIVPPLQR